MYDNQECWRSAYLFAVLLSHVAWLRSAIVPLVQEKHLLKKTRTAGKSCVRAHSLCAARGLASCSEAKRYVEGTRCLLVPSRRRDMTQITDGSVGHTKLEFISTSLPRKRRMARRTSCNRLLRPPSYT